ncbi:hypothetical protein SELMODRAFT_403268 [Selaginella moellendorffii]|uniref:Uncharacterized protein n=1 Tax=Selaginella moellendorffii TaxID=88036 RepID=D8QTL9_SELML|nr:hypothetical protein SELMODRAFT_403268 [Selaginella moellendorffii]
MGSPLCCMQDRHHTTASSLKLFHFHNNMTGDQGVRSLTRLVEKVVQLENFCFSSTRVGVALALAIAGGSTVKVLDLRDNRFRGGQGHNLHDTAALRMDIVYLLISDSCSSWQATVYERYIGNVRGLGFHPSLQEEDSESMSYLASLLLDNGVMTRDCLLESFTSHTPQEVDDHHLPRLWTPLRRITSTSKARSVVHRIRGLRTSRVVHSRQDSGKVRGLGRGAGHPFHEDCCGSHHAPGMHYNVASDGHVFFDLVGSDDAALDSYGMMFWKMVSFFSLDEFLLDNHSEDKIANLLSNTAVEHPVVKLFTWKISTMLNLHTVP